MINGPALQRRRILQTLNYSTASEGTGCHTQQSYPLDSQVIVASGGFARGIVLSARGTVMLVSSQLSVASGHFARATVLRARGTVMVVSSLLCKASRISEPSLIPITKRVARKPPFIIVSIFCNVDASYYGVAE